VSSVTATMQQYGAWTPVGQLAWTQGLDPIVEEMSTMYGELAGDTLDQVARAALTGGTSVILSGSSASRSTIASCSAGFLAEADFRAAVRTLTRQNARRIPSEGNRFPAIVHPDTWFDFMGNTTIQNVLQNAGVRGNDNPLFTGEMYDYLGIRAKVSSNAKTLGLSLIVTVYQTLVFGQEAYGEVRFGSYGSPEIITHAPGTSGVYDPLNTRGSVGFKASLVVKILNDNFMTRIESSSSLNPQTTN
jgi:N4-gp56 family major capsid protein